MAVICHNRQLIEFWKNHLEKSLDRNFYRNFFNCTLSLYENVKLEKILICVLSDEIFEIKHRPSEDLSDFRSLEKIREKVSESVSMKIRVDDSLKQ